MNQYSITIGGQTHVVAGNTQGHAARLLFRKLISRGAMRQQPRSQDGGWVGVSITLAATAIVVSDFVREFTAERPGNHGMDYWRRKLPKASVALAHGKPNRFKYDPNPVHFPKSEWARPEWVPPTPEPVVPKPKPIVPWRPRYEWPEKIKQRKPLGRFAIRKMNALQLFDAMQDGRVKERTYQMTMRDLRVLASKGRLPIARAA